MFTSICSSGFVDTILKLGDQRVHEGFDSITFDFDSAIFAYRPLTILDSYRSPKELLVDMAQYCSDLDLADGTCCRDTAQIGCPPAWPKRHQGKRRGKGTHSEGGTR